MTASISRSVRRRPLVAVLTTVLMVGALTAAGLLAGGFLVRSLIVDPIGGRPAPWPGSGSEHAPVDSLDPGLVAAFDRAQAAAAQAGHTLVINSGFRTAAEQQALLDEAVIQYGSLAEATRWVFPPERSMHVQGLAIDVGDEPAAAWLESAGAELGLCRTLSWEWWHFEWRESWQRSGSCPAPVDDPGMHQV